MWIEVLEQFLITCKIYKNWKALIKSRISKVTDKAKENYDEIRNLEDSRIKKRNNNYYVKNREDPSEYGSAHRNEEK